MILDHISSRKILSINAFMNDDDWAGDSDTRRSYIGACFYMRLNLVN